MSASLILCALLHTLAAMTLFGTLAVRPILAAAGGPAEHCLIRTAAGGALLTAVLWLLLEAGDMAGSPAAMLDPTTLGTVLGDTAFGHVWLGRLILSAAVVALAWREHRQLLLGLAAAQLASLGLIGHAAMATGWNGALQRGNQALHLLAGGAWLGALPPLLLILARARRNGEPAELARALRRFSGFGAAAVAVLLGTGAVNVWVRTAGGRGWLGTPYGTVLLVKLVLVAAMIGLALLNRLVLTPRLAKAPSLRGLSLSLSVESLGGLLVLTAAFVLGSTEPP